MAAAAAVPPAKQRVVLMPLGGAQMWEGFSKGACPFGDFNGMQRFSASRL